jgi:hypothetical protein
MILYIILYYIILYCIVLYCIWYDIILYIILYYIIFILYYIILYYTWYYIILYIHYMYIYRADRSRPGVFNCLRCMSANFLQDQAESQRSLGSFLSRWGISRVRRLNHFIRLLAGSEEPLLPWLLLKHVATTCSCTPWKRNSVYLRRSLRPVPARQKAPAFERNSFSSSRQRQPKGLDTWPSTQVKTRVARFRHVLTNTQTCLREKTVWVWPFRICWKMGVMAAYISQSRFSGLDFKLHSR